MESEKKLDIKLLQKRFDNLKKEILKDEIKKDKNKNGI